MSEFEAKNEKEIIRPARVKYNPTDEEYELDFDRESVVFAQRSGFVIDDIDSKPNIVIPELFYYAMRKNHKRLARNQVEAIRKKLFPDGIPQMLLRRLTDLYYQAAYTELIYDEEEEPEKNSQTVVELD